MKQWYESKTIWFNVLSLLLLGINYWQDIDKDPTHLQWYGFGILVINGILRLTSSKEIRTK